MVTPESRDSLFLCIHSLALIQSFTNERIQELTKKSHKYFRVNDLFLPASVNPTVWTSGNNALAYCKEVFQKYGQGCYKKKCYSLEITERLGHEPS